MILVKKNNMVSSRKTSASEIPTTPESLVWQTGQRVLKGGVSGLISGGLLQPLQVIKTSMQVSPVVAAKHLNGSVVASQSDGTNLNKQQSQRAKVHLSFREACKLIYTNEGPQGFLRGLVPSLMKNTLNSGTYFGILFYTEERLKKLNLLTPGQIQMVSSGFARSV